jgi:hypothetical protein
MDMEPQTATIMNMVIKRTIYTSPDMIRGTSLTITTNRKKLQKEATVITTQTWA